MSCSVWSSGFPSREGSNQLRLQSSLVCVTSSRCPGLAFLAILSCFYSPRWSPLRAQANLLSSIWMPDSGERLMENYPKLDRIYNKTISLLGDPKAKVNQRDIPVTLKFRGRETAEFGPSRTCAGPGWPWRWSLAPAWFALLILTLYADRWNVVRETLKLIYRR